MISKLLLLIRMAETLVLQGSWHLVPQRWTRVGPLCPQEVLKRPESPSKLVAQRRERVSPNRQEA